jgi:CTP synthase (UTP-ammonia lyase)
LGKTVQVVPHVTDAIQQWVERVALIPVDKEDKVKKPEVTTKVEVFFRATF